MNERSELAESLIADLLVIEETRHEALTVLKRGAERRQIRRRDSKVFHQIVNALLAFRIIEQRRQRALPRFEALLHSGHDRLQRFGALHE